jgi:site-specific recombinase XerD
MNGGLERYLKEYLEYLEIEQGRSARTVRNYDFYLRRFADWAGKKVGPRDITSDLLRRYRLWLNRLQEGRDEETLKTF